MAGDGGLFDPIFTGDALLAATSDRAWLQAMLDAEGALAAAGADLGLVPPDLAATIRRACRAEHFDVDELGRAARRTGNPVVPLVERLRAAVGAAGTFVHLGATSQDIIDSATMVVAARSLSIISADADILGAGCARLAEQHRATLMLARTLLQPATPTTFGLKAAGWLVAVDRTRAGLAGLGGRLAAQLGGAGGTLASLGSAGPGVVERYAHHLGLPAPLLPWHTDRTRVAELATALAIAAGVASKIALDVILLAQDEVAEVAEATGPGRGGSSTMPQKRNPAGSVAVRAAAHRVPGLVAGLLGGMAQEHERAAGAWHAEWQAVQALLRVAGGSVAGAAEVVTGLEVDPARMRHNLERTGGAVLAERVAATLGTVVGRAAADAAVREAASSAPTSFGDALAAQPVVAASLDGEELRRLLDPSGYLGSADAFVDRALAAHRAEAAAR